MLFSDEYYMKLALKEATYAYEEDEVPVGAIVICNNRIIGKGYNQTERLKDVTAHAEMLAITAAANYLGSKFLEGCTLYVTLEPCLMCAGAFYWSKIGSIIFGASDEKNGYHKTTLSNWPFHPKTTLITGVLKEECALLMQEFFRARR